MTPDEAEHADEADFMEPLKRLLELLVRESRGDAVRRQMLIEFMLANHAWSANRLDKAFIIIDAVAKHAKQRISGKDMLLDGQMRPPR